MTYYDEPTMMHPQWWTHLDALLPGADLQVLKAGSRNISMPMFMSSLFTKANNKRTQTNCPQVNEWINKCTIKYNNKPTVKHYPNFKKKEILAHITRWMNPEDIMLSKMSQSQKDQHCVTALIWSTRNSHIPETEQRKEGWLMSWGGKEEC